MNVFLEIRPEVLECALERIHRTGRQRTECVSGPEQLAVKIQDLEVPRIRVIRQDPVITVHDLAETFRQARGILEEVWNQAAEDQAVADEQVDLTVRTFKAAYPPYFCQNMFAGIVR